MSADPGYRVRLNARIGKGLSTDDSTANFHGRALTVRAVFEGGSGTRILTLSDAQAPQFQRHYGTPAGRFHALPPGIERDRAAAPDRRAVRCRLRREFGLDGADLLLLFVGSGFVVKGLNRVLLGLRALPPRLRERTWLYILGEDKPGRFQRMARRLGLARRVRFLGGRSDVPDFLQAGDGLVLPALDETAGMVILEAMIAGLPALVTGNCGCASRVQEAQAGIFGFSRVVLVGDRGMLTAARIREDVLKTVDPKVRPVFHRTAD